MLKTNKCLQSWQRHTERDHLASHALTACSHVLASRLKPRAHEAVLGALEVRGDPRAAEGALPSASLCTGGASGKKQLQRNSWNV